MYLLLLSVIYLAFISLGLPDSLLGSAWPTIYAEFDIPVSYMGFVSMIISAGTIVSSLMTDRLTAKFGTRTVTTASIFLTAVALFGFSTATDFYQICIWGIPYGLGAGAIDAALNNYVALHYNSRHMSWLHCFWGIGTIVSPYVMSYALTHSVWQGGYRTISFIQFGIAVILILTFPLWKINKNKDKEKIETEPIGPISAFKTKGVASVLIGFMAYCAAEATTMLWASTYFEDMFNMTKDGAAALGSLFFIGMTVGRFLSGLISDRLGDSKIIKLGSIIAFVGIILVAIPVKFIATSGFVIIGLGCAPIYPSIIHSTPTKFGKERSQSIIGIQMAAAYFGSTFMPPIFGIIANGVSIKLLPIYLAFFMILMLVMINKSEQETAL